MAEKTVWHYSVYAHLLTMLRDGFIRPATTFVKPPERPIVWFSKSQTWERTVTKGVRLPDGSSVTLDFRGMLSHGVRPVRIAVSPEIAPYDWPALRRLSGMESRMANGLVRVAGELGADPRNWRGTLPSRPSGTRQYLSEYRVTHPLAPQVNHVIRLPMFVKTSNLIEEKAKSR
jgi:hypothetical protein